MPKEQVGTVTASPPWLRGVGAPEVGENPAGRGKAAAAAQGILLTERRWGAEPNPHGRSKDGASRGLRTCGEKNPGALPGLPQEPPALLR